MRKILSFLLCCWPGRNNSLILSKSTENCSETFNYRDTIEPNASAADGLKTT